MCGRYTLHSPYEIIAQIFKIASIKAIMTPRYNIAPSQDIVMVVDEEGERRLASCKLGFAPSWAKDLKTGYKMINARAESLSEKGRYKTAFEKQRCLIVADGFYEWRKAGGKKTPVYVRLKSGKPFGFAGLFNIWTSPQGEKTCTSAIITTTANELLVPIHDRMPAIAPEDKHDLWLDPKFDDIAALQDVLKPYQSNELELYDVSAAVNSPKNDSPENIKPVRGGA